MLAAATSTAGPLFLPRKDWVYQAEYINFSRHALSVTIVPHLLPLLPWLLYSQEDREYQSVSLMDKKHWLPSPPQKKPKNQQSQDI